MAQTTQVYLKVGFNPRARTTRKKKQPFLARTARFKPYLGLRPRARITSIYLSLFSLLTISHGLQTDGVNLGGSGANSSSWLPRPKHTHGHSWFTHGCFRGWLGFRALKARSSGKIGSLFSGVVKNMSGKTGSLQSYTSEPCVE